MPRNNSAARIAEVAAPEILAEIDVPMNTDAAYFGVEAATRQLNPVLTRAAEEVHKLGGRLTITLTKSA